MAAPTPPPSTDPFEAAAAAPDTPPTPPRRSSRLLRWLVWGTVDLLALLLVLAGALWWWAGSSSSLAVVLEQAQRFLPAGQTLQASEVSGSLRAGGQIGNLRWQSPHMVVEVQKLDIGWRLRPLLQRELHLGQLHAQSISIEQIGEPDPSPTEPLQELTLPLQLDVPFRVDALRWVGPPPLQISALAGHYRYDGQHHQLKVDGVDVADGHYSAQLQLQGVAPMALEATLQGRITTPVPGSSQPPLTLAAQAQVQGTLAGTEARLQAQAQVQPDASTPSTSSPAMQAKVQADIAPWASQPLLQAQADFQALDLARLWPDAPATLLGGTVSAGPAQASGSATAAPPLAAQAPTGTCRPTSATACPALGTRTACRPARSAPAPSSTAAPGWCPPPPCGWARAKCACRGGGVRPLPPGSCRPPCSSCRPPRCTPSWPPTC